jgi:hypothetical protein
MPGKHLNLADNEFPMAGSFCRFQCGIGRFTLHDTERASTFAVNVSYIYAETLVLVDFVKVFAK